MKPIHALIAVLSLTPLLPGCAFRLEPGYEPLEPAPIDLADPVLNQRRIFVTGNITEASAADTIRQLLHLDAQNQEPISLYLMTPGGDLKAVLAVVNTLRMLHSKVDTYALGECNSGGAVLLAAGTGKRYAFPDSTIVIHGMEMDRKPPARYVELTQEAYTAFWRQHARLPESWLPIPLGELFFLTAREALDYGVVDQIIPLRARRP
ncbi:MAG: ClpP family protease [Limisphaerales bacterium]